MSLLSKAQSLSLALFISIGAATSPAVSGVHVDIGIGSPAYYGALPIEGVMPNLWNASPVVAIGATVLGLAPIYLTVPNAHRLHWKEYCDRYNACERPVYFVKRPWYDKHYEKVGHHRPPKPPKHHYDRPHDRPHGDHDRGFEHRGGPKNFGHGGKRHHHKHDD